MSKPTEHSSSIEDNAKEEASLVASLVEKINNSSLNNINPLIAR